MYIINILGVKILKKVLSLFISVITVISMFSFGQTVFAMSELELGKFVPVVLENDGSTQVYTFTPEKSGKYVLTSHAKGKVDPKCTVNVMPSGNTVALIDDTDGFVPNFREILELKQGVEYHFIFGMNNMNTTAEYDVDLFAYTKPEPEPEPPQKVTGLYTAGRGDGGTRIRIAWDAVNGATEYKIYQNINHEYKCIGTSTTTEFNVTGLNPSWEYYFKVSAVVNGKETVMSDELHTAAACAPVPDLTAKVVSDNQISLTWTDGVCHGYYIEWSTDPSFKTGAQGISVSGSATNSRTITVNGNAENYYVRIRAWRVWNDGYIYGDFSDGVKATKPIKVTGLYAAGRGDGGTRIRLAWDAVDGATEYKIYQNIDHEYKYIGSSSTTEFNVTELNPSWEYYFKVTAVKDGVESELSDELHTVAACAPVPDLTAKVVSDNQISLTWTDGVCHGYYIQWSTDSTFKTGTQGEYVSGSATNSKTITVNGNAEDYYVRIRAWRYWQDGYTFGDFSDGVKATKPIKVTGLYAAGRGDGGTRIRLAWDAVNGATEYKIYQNIDHEYKYIGSSNTTQYNVTGLNPSWEYYFKVTAVVNGEECEMSDELHTVAACAPVPNLKAKVVSDNQISLTWTDGVCHGYYIQWSTDPTFETGTQGEYVSGSATNSRTITVNGNAKNYYVRIRAWRYWQDGYTYGDFSQGVKA